MIYLCRFKIMVKYMPFNNKRNSRDTKSNHGGKPSFGKKAEGSTNRDNRFDDRKPHSKRPEQASGTSFDAKKSDDNRQRPYKKNTTSSTSRFSKTQDRPFKKDENFKRDEKPFKKSIDKKEDRLRKDNLYKKENHFKKEDKPFRRSGEFKKTERPRKDTPFRKDDSFKREDKPFRKSGDFKKGDRPRREAPYHKEENPKESKSRSFGEPELIRLNRYIANAGICSRRKADELIEAGVVSINGEVVTSLGTRVNPATDEVKYNGERLKREKMVYILL